MGEERDAAAASRMGVCQQDCLGNPEAGLPRLISNPSVYPGSQGYLHFEICFSLQMLKLRHAAARLPSRSVV